MVILGGFLKRKITKRHPEDHFHYFLKFELPFLLEILPHKLEKLPPISLKSWGFPSFNFPKSKIFHCQFFSRYFLVAVIFVRTVCAMQDGVPKYFLHYAA